MTNGEAKRDLALLDRGLTIDQMKERATLLVKSGFLPKTVDTPEKAVAIMLLGAEYGIPPMKAFQSIDVIDGKPALSAQLQLALCQATQELEDVVIEHTKTKCTVKMKRKGRTLYVSEFGDEQATAMKAREWDKQANCSRVISLIEKYNYRTMKSIMYEWRALSRACRVVFPDAVLGLHTADELEDVITQAQEDKIEKKAEHADAAVEHKEALEAPVEAAGETVHAIHEEDELFLKLASSFIKDERFYKWYPEKTLGEIIQITTPGGKQKGRTFLVKVHKESNSPEDTANIEKFLELYDAQKETK